MVAPGSLEARYGRLAGPLNKRQELYLARRRLLFTIDEWQALPWWQRRVYIEGLGAEADATIDARPQHRSGRSGLDAIYSGSLADVAATTGVSTG